MIEKHVKKPIVVNSIENTSFRSSIEGFSEYLNKNGYSNRSLNDYLRVINHFCYWLNAENIALCTINTDTVNVFLYDHFKKCCCPIPKGKPIRICSIALKHFLKMLQRVNIIVPPEKSHSLSCADKIMCEFRTYLENVNGVMASTMHLYSRHIKKFLQQQYENDMIEFQQLTIDEVREYVCNKAKRYKPKTSKVLSTSLRAFFRFLLMTNRILHPLHDAVPSVAYRRLSTIPKYLTGDQFEILLSSFNVSSPIGLRNKAMAYLMARLGLRSHEAVQITIEDINWREATITIKKNKSRRTLYLPLTKEIGDIVALYLQKGRPYTEERRIFVTHALPKGKPLSERGLQAAIREAFKHCKLEVPSNGTHMLRHTLATQLLQKGARLKEIADILDHCSIDTTFIYTKVNLKQLDQVTLSWPE